MNKGFFYCTFSIKLLLAAVSKLFYFLQELIIFRSIIDLKPLKQLTFQCMEYLKSKDQNSMKLKIPPVLENVKVKGYTQYRHSCYILQSISDLGEQGTPQVCITGACSKVIMKGMDGERSITRGCANKSVHGLRCTKYILFFSSSDPFKYLERKGEYHKLFILSL